MRILLKIELPLGENSVTVTRLYSVTSNKRIIFALTRSFALQLLFKIDNSL